MKDRNEEIAGLRRSLRERDETIQQREIDISCLRGQVNKAMGRVTRAILDLDSVKDDDDFSDDTLTFVDGSLIDDEEEILLSDLMMDMSGYETPAPVPAYIRKQGSERAKTDSLTPSPPSTASDDTLAVTPIPSRSPSPPSPQLPPKKDQK